MSKVNSLTISADSVGEALEKMNGLLKPIQITSATIKDGMCNYGYEILSGPGKGDKIPTRKGSAVVHDDMSEAFRLLNVHLAIIDDAFKYISKKSLTLDQLQDHEIAEGFGVTGIKISGSDENEGIILIGYKDVTTGIISLESPKISATSGYAFYDELKEAIDKVIMEVEDYMNGKAAAKEEMPELPFPTEGDGDEFDNPIN